MARLKRELAQFSTGLTNINSHIENLNTEISELQKTSEAATRKTQGLEENIQQNTDLYWKLDAKMKRDEQESNKKIVEKKRDPQSGNCETRSGCQGAATNN